MVRGIGRRAIFRDAQDREEFVRRVAALATAGAWGLLAHVGRRNGASLVGSIRFGGSRTN